MNRKAHDFENGAYLCSALALVAALIALLFLADAANGQDVRVLMIDNRGIVRWAPTDKTVRWDGTVLSAPGTTTVVPPPMQLPTLYETYATVANPNDTYAANPPAMVAGETPQDRRLGAIQVYLNGVKLSPFRDFDFQLAVREGIVKLARPPRVGDEITMVWLLK